MTVIFIGEQIPEQSKFFFSGIRKFGKILENYHYPKIPIIELELCYTQLCKLNYLKISA